MEGDQPATAPREPFGRLLKRLRRAAGLSQERLAERAGLSWRTISDLERGVKQAPRPSTLQLLAAALSLSPEQRAALQASAFPADDVVAAPGTGSAAPLAGPNVPTNLPLALSSFVGRERDVCSAKRAWPWSYKKLWPMRSRRTHQSN